MAKDNFITNERIDLTLHPFSIAEHIYKKFEIGNSCTIKGFIIQGEDVISKGDLVLEELTLMDKLDNTNTPIGDKRPRRKRVQVPDSIGGYVAQKIFKFEKRIIDNTPRVTIWRMQ